MAFVAQALDRSFRVAHPRIVGQMVLLMIVKCEFEIGGKKVIAVDHNCQLLPLPVRNCVGSSVPPYSTRGFLASRWGGSRWKLPSGGFRTGHMTCTLQGYGRNIYAADGACRAAGRSVMVLELSVADVPMVEICGGGEIDSTRGRSAEMDGRNERMDCPKVCLFPEPTYGLGRIIVAREGGRTAGFRLGKM